ncbi:YncE family protein [Pseudoduganella sp. UC29_106]|uniref:YncE family protein n=1 Tax=Pseudoduganella sp. UC29_106 TaxID=3374553 RepID=UPI003756D006
MSGVPAWITPSATSGAVNENGSTVRFTANTSALPAGTSSAVVNATAIVNGDTVVKPVTLTVNRDQRKLVPSDVGVALVSVPGWTRLNATIKISDNFGLGATWTASSSQPWLTVSQNGDTLTLSAAPSTPLETISYATVTLSPTTAGVAAPEVVRVALWRSAYAPATAFRVKTSYWRVAADPIRPLVYVHNGDSKIDVYNVYTGQLVLSTAALGSTLGDMAVSPNGDRLYAVDRGGRSIVVVDLATMTKQAAWPVTGVTDLETKLKVIRPNGEELLLTSEQGAYRVATGRRLATPFRTGIIAASPDGRRVYVQNERDSTTVSIYDVDFSAMGGGTLFAVEGRTAYAGNGSSGNDIAVSTDGTRVYSASATPSRCTVAKASDFSNLGILPGGEPWPSNVEVDSLGRVYCGSAAPYGNNDVWMHSATGTLLKAFRLSGVGKNLLERQLVVSGDGMMLIGVTDDPSITFIAVGP